MFFLCTNMEGISNRQQGPWPMADWLTDECTLTHSLSLKHTLTLAIVELSSTSHRLTYSGLNSSRIVSHYFILQFLQTHGLTGAHTGRHHSECQSWRNLLYCVHCSPSWSSSTSLYHLIRMFYSVFIGVIVLVVVLPHNFWSFRS